MDQFYSSDEQDRVFGIPPGCDFSKTLIAGLIERTKEMPKDALARIEIFTNTRRAARRIEDLFLDGTASFMPQIRVITDLGNDPLLGDAPEVSQTSLSTQLAMMQAVKKLLESGQSLAPVSSSFDLAGSLQTLMDEMEGEGVLPATLLELDVSDHSEHWKTALSFLRIIETSGLAHTGAPLGSDARQRIAVEALAALWRASPPKHPVLIAGSTGSRGTTALFMKEVLALPLGALILPGFDFDLNARSKEALLDQETPSVDHPQFGFAQLSSRLSFDLDAVGPWTAAKPPSSTRNKLVSLALRPAPITDDWLNEGPHHADDLGSSTAGLSLLETPNERFEAASIAFALRASIEEEKSAVLITPDATLARRVTAELNRWGITPDDSAGVPLRFTPPAIFFDLVLQAVSGDLETPKFLAILKHPLCAAGWERGIHLRFTRRLDAEILRDIGPLVDWSSLLKWSEKIEGATVWINWLKSCFDQSVPPQTFTLAGFLDLHRLGASKFVSGPDNGSDEALWDKNAGAKVSELLTQIDKDAHLGSELTHLEYSTIFRSLMVGETVRPDGFIPDKRVSIWGQLEARVQAADLVILGGLNEGVWPKQPAPDPWLNRHMRQAIGLQVPERRIGLSAHDFQQAICNAEVILSRSQKQDNTPTVPSRWLTRLQNLLSGLGEKGEDALAQMSARGARYLQWAESIDQPLGELKKEPRPCPAPPLLSRPERISVTQVERLIRDPYAIYAEKILGLRPLAPIGRDANARDRGIGFHKVMEEFIKTVWDEVPPDGESIFKNVAAHTLQECVPWPSQRRIWLGRLKRISADFVERERERRRFGAPTLTEERGSLVVPNTPRPLKLTCNVDRIDTAPDGQIAIYDYKSSIPTDKQMKIFSKQLELEAYIALKGGFEKLGPVRAKHLELIGLSKAGEAEEKASEPDEISQIWDGFLKLMLHFENEANGYSARLKSMRDDMWGDYDHLARRGEWEDNALLNAEPLT